MSPVLRSSAVRFRGGGDILLRCVRRNRNLLSAFSFVSSMPRAIRRLKRCPSSASVSSEIGHASLSPLQLWIGARLNYFRAVRVLTGFHALFGLTFHPLDVLLHRLDCLFRYCMDTFQSFFA